MVSAAFVEHAVLGFAFAILSLFVLAIALIAVVLLTITHHCWWSYGNFICVQLDKQKYRR